MSKVLNTWTFGGVRLDSFGFLTDLTSYLDIPSKRSENVLVPLNDGRVHAKKFFDQRSMTFGLLVQADNIHELEEKIDSLKLLLGSRDQQALAYQAHDGIRSALAEVVNQISATRDTDPLSVDYILDFLLADPFFRSTTLYSLEVTANASPKAMDIVNNGTVDERTAIITFTGPMEHPKIEHMASGIYVQYNAHISAGHTVTIDCKNYTAVHSVSGNVINYIVHSGDPCFLPILPGTNHCHVTDSNPTTGKAKIEFYPPYL